MNKLSRSQASTLSNLIRKFNAKASQLPFRDFYRADYQELKSLISNKRDYNKVIRRLKSFLKPGSDKIIVNDKGVRMTRWERDQLRYTQKAANKTREKMLVKYQERNKYRQIPTETELAYRPKNWDYNSPRGRTILNGMLETQLKMSLGGYEQYRDESYIKAYLSHFDVLPEGYPMLNKIRYLINHTDHSILGDVLTDSSFADTIQNHYVFWSRNSEMIEDALEEIYERLKTGIQFYSR